MKTKNIVDQSTLKAQVYNHLRDRIFSGDLPEGQRLVVAEIAEELKVSLTPVREALSQLTIEGYVTTIPRRGSFVRRLCNEEFLETYEILGVLDSYAAKKAASRISDAALKKIERLTAEMSKNDSIEEYVAKNREIHGLIAKESGSVVLLRITNRLREEVTRYRYVSLAVDKRMAQSRKEHRRIVETLKKRDGEAAAKVLEEHRRNTFEAMQNYIRSREQESKKS